MTETEYTQKVFINLVSNQQLRLKKGLRLRQEMHEQLAKGIQPEGYRASWLKESALGVIDYLGGLAEKFDETHLDDRCSANDLADILATAMSILKKSAGVSD